MKSSRSGATYTMIWERQRAMRRSLGVGVLVLIALVIVALLGSACTGSGRGVESASPGGLTQVEQTVGADRCERSAATATRTETLETPDGRLRTYRLHVPEVAGTGMLPLVIDFHGAGTTAERQAKVSQFERIADRDSFIVATPDGTDQRWSASDIDYIEQLLDHVIETQCVDSNQVFAAGMSNGGFFSARLMCDLGDRFAAIATVTGISYPSCAPTAAIPIVHFHGTADQIVDFGGIPAEVDLWAGAMNCAPEPEVRAVTSSVELRSYRSCDSGGAIDFYVIEGGGHTWPGSAETVRLESVLGATNTEIDATELIWKWFVAAANLD